MPTCLSFQEQGLELCKETQQAFGIQGLFAFCVIEVGSQGRASLLTWSVGFSCRKPQLQKSLEPPEEAECPSPS